MGRFCGGWILLFLGASGALAQPYLDLGSSPNFVGSGARALGQGNAFIAVADDATAASWNPAGLAQLEAPEISLAVEAYRRRADLTSRDHAESAATYAGSLQDLNYTSVAFPFNLGRHMVVSLNYLKQYRFDRELRFDWTQVQPFGTVSLTHDLDQEGSLSVLGLALAADITRRLALGVTFNVWDDDLTGASSYRKTQVEDVVMTVPMPPFPPMVFNSQVYQEDQLTVDRGYSLVLGGLYRISAAWTLGMVAKPPYELHMTHEQLLRITPGMAATTTVTEPDVEFPWILGVGAAWRPSDPWTVSADATWTQWSEFTLTENGAEQNPITEGSISTEECDDTWSCRVGAEYLLVFEDHVVPLRCGLGYDPTPAVDRTDEFYTASLGIGFQTGRFMVDLAYEARWGQNVHGSTMRGLNASEDVLRHRLLTSLIVYF